MPAKQSASEFIGLKYGRLTVVEDKGTRNGRRYVMAKCDCGTIDKFDLGCLKSSNTKSCGCIKKDKVFDAIGKKYGRLTIKNYKGIENRRSIVLAECDCGVIKKYDFHHIQNKQVKSCGCLVKERSVHNGLSSHPLYIIWNNMLRRCYDEKEDSYKYYGGRGVKVSMRWENDFEAFYEWAIKRWKPGLQLDKDIKSSTGSGILYCPELCCFVTPKENSRKRKTNIILEYKGEKKCITEWAESLGVSFKTVYGRYKRGSSIDKIIESIKK